MVRKLIYNGYIRGSKTGNVHANFYFIKDLSNLSELNYMIEEDLI